MDSTLTPANQAKASSRLSLSYTCAVECDASEIVIVRSSGSQSLAAGTPVRESGNLTRMARRSAYPAVALVAVTLVVVWNVSGVPIADVLRFAIFEGLYVVLPGCLLYLLLSPELPIRSGRLRVLAIGWPLGYAIEIGMFALTAALHARGVLTFLPLLTLVTLGPGAAYRFRGAQAREPALPSGSGRDRRSRGADSLIGAMAIAIALTLLAVRSFAKVPLPGHASSVFYFVDNLWDISLASEALHHWPIAESYMAGHPLRYYVGVFIHVAALKQVVGVPSATSIFRLLPAMSTVVVMLQFWYLGSSFGRSRWAGPITVVLLLAVENMKLYPTHTKIFGVALFSEFTGSPTYGFGIMFLLALLILCRAHILGIDLSRPVGTIRRRSSPTRKLGTLLMLCFLVLGAGAVKTTAAATFVGGLCLFWLWQALNKRFDRLLSYAAAVSLACLAGTYLLLLSGSKAPAATEIAPEPLDFLKYTVFKSLVASHPSTIVLAAAAVVIALWKILPVAGPLWWLRSRNEWSSYWDFALAIFVVGFTVYVIMGSPAGNESYFIWYGYIGLIPLTTVTTMTLWRGLPSDLHARSVRVGVLALILGLVVVGSTQILSASGELVGARRAAWYGVMLVPVCALLVVWGLRFARGLPAWRGLRDPRALVLCLFFLCVLGCSDSLVLALPDAWRTALDRHSILRDSPSQPGLTAALYSGLLWVRSHTNRCDILAVSPPMIRSAAGETADSGYFDYSAFTEREVFFESWVMTIQGQHGEQPYPATYALNDAATRQGDQAALRELAHGGVSYILIDKIHGADARGPGSMGRLVFSNSALDVYRMTAPVGTHSC